MRFGLNKNKQPEPSAPSLHDIRLETLSLDSPNALDELYTEFPSIDQQLISEMYESNGQNIEITRAEIKVNLEYQQPQEQHLIAEQDPDTTPGPPKHIPFEHETNADDPPPISDNPASLEQQDFALNLAEDVNDDSDLIERSSSCSYFSGLSPVQFLYLLPRLRSLSSSLPRDTRGYMTFVSMIDEVSARISSLVVAEVVVTSIDLSEISNLVTMYKDYKGKLIRIYVEGVDTLDQVRGALCCAKGDSRLVSFCGDSELFIVI
ncbi:hypothetical protein GEMRC1_007288 [Eukaryota sp. GEM-RC1]